MGMNRCMIGPPSRSAAMVVRDEVAGVDPPAQRGGSQCGQGGDQGAEDQQTFHGLWPPMAISMPPSSSVRGLMDRPTDASSDESRGLPATALSCHANMPGLVRYATPGQLTCT